MLDYRLTVNINMIKFFIAQHHIVTKYTNINKKLFLAMRFGP
jgi:hypothetical protein